jgi:hypothetical protein
MSRYTLTPTWIDLENSGWELSGAAHGLHTTFDKQNYDRNVEMAMDWAEELIGLGRLDWRHIRDNHGERWEVGS